MPLTVLNASGQHSADSTALMALYNSTDGPNWDNNGNWGTNKSLNQWYGITTNANGRVSKIILEWNDLNGTLPPEIGLLEELVEINFRYNSISGAIPNELYDLTNLQKINFSSNDLSGTISDSIGNLTQLTRFEFWSNQLSGNIPESIGNLTKLNVLDIGSNQLTGTLPNTMGNLMALAYLFLENNRIEGSIPQQFTNLNNIKTISLHTNLFTHVEGGINFSNNPTINVSNNNLNFEDLEKLDNSTIGTLNYANQTTVYNTAKQQSGLPGLKDTLAIVGATAAGNQFQWYKDDVAIAGATDSLYVINSVQTSDTGEYTVKVTNSIYNGITIYREPITYDAICDDRCALMALYNSTDGPNWKDNLNWTTNKPLDQWFGITTNANGRVSKIELSWNLLNGALPMEIGLLDELTELDCRYNAISGTIPNELYNLTNLQKINFSSNDLSGTISSRIENLSELTRIEFWSNNLSGSIPESIVNLNKLSMLDLAENNIIGALPDSMGKLVQLNFLYLDGNDITGSIPAQLGNLNNIQNIFLSDNQFSYVERGLSFSNNPSIYVGNNKLDFEDLAELDNSTNGTFNYANQTTVYNTPEHMDGTIGFMDTLAVTAAYAAGNQFQWFKDNVAIVGATDSIYVINPVTLDHAGTYTVEITNGAYTSETFYREPINYTVTVKPLPVVLISFEVEEQFGEVFVQWTTESEINADYFEVQRSTDGINWNYVNTVNANGNSNITRNYETVDTKPINGLSYYRLKQVDYNGVFEIFDPKAVEIKTEKYAANTEVYPSPFKDELFIKLEGTNEPVNVQVFTLQGQLVHNQTIFGNGNHVVDIDNNLPTGIYLVSYQLQGEITTKKVVKN